jgi:transcriptional regulator with XRE-family HTH domain
VSPRGRARSYDAREYAARVLISNRLKEAREAAGLTQRALAARLGRSQSFVADIEGRNRRVSVTELWLLADAVGRAVGDFVAPPKDDHEREEWDWALTEFASGDAPPPRDRRTLEGRRQARRRE